MNWAERKIDCPGLVFEPNPEAELIQQYLGVAVPYPPAKAIYSETNKRILKAAGNNDLLKRLERSMSGAAGVYMADCNTFFVRSKQTSTGTSLHENGHALRAQLGEKKASEVVLGSLEDTDLNDLQMKTAYWAQFCYNEGFSEWIQCEVSQRIRGVDPDKIFIDHIKSATDLVREAQTPAHLLWYYGSGQLYADRVMRALTQGNGMSLQEAIPFYVNNPPINYDEVKEPLLNSYLGRMRELGKL